MHAASWLAPLVTLAQIESVTLTPLGATIMVLSVCSVLALVTFCLYRVLTLPPVEEVPIKGPLEIDTGDTNNAD